MPEIYFGINLIIQGAEIREDATGYLILINNYTAHLTVSVFNVYKKWPQLRAIFYKHMQFFLANSHIKRNSKHLLSCMRCITIICLYLQWRIIYLL